MSKSLDRLTLLETFVRIAERGSISGAARDLGLSQASASRQLKELEDRLGHELIRRTTHSLSLTTAGEELLRDARQLISSWSAFEERHMITDGQVKGPLKVIAPIALGQRQLADIALDFQLRNPDVTLTWELADEAIRFAEVGCDCWIKVGRIPNENLIVRLLGRVERMVVASPDLIGRYEFTSRDDVSNLPFVALNPFEGGRITLQSKSDQQIHLEPRITLATNNIFSLHRAVVKGLGAAILPRWFIEEELAKKMLIDVLPQWRAAKLDVNVAFLPARHQPKRLELFLKALAEGFQRIPGIESPDA